ncbi:MAG: hypothetical protein GY937_14260 [bacterium]|nr:hypothetical protein [bacterium]
MILNTKSLRFTGSYMPGYHLSGLPDSGGDKEADTPVIAIGTCTKL